MTVPIESLWPLICEVLNAAVENGFEEIIGWSILEIACDLTTYCSTFERYEPEDLEPLIKRWRELRSPIVNWKGEGF